MLTKEEIKSFHNNFKVLRKHKIGGVEFVISSFTWGAEKEFVRIFEDFDKQDTDVFVKNTIATAILEGCLVSFGGESKSEEEIDNFSSSKVNFIVKKYKQLSSDIEEYLNGFEPQDLTDEEVGEFILTDRIARNIKLNFDEETPAIKIKYKILNVKENKRVGKRIREKIEEDDVKTKVHLENLNEQEFALEMIEHINGMELNEENMEDLSIELIKFILRRADRLEKEIKDALNTPENVGESLKN
jgi:hypothetical protein